MMYFLTDSIQIFFHLLKEATGDFFERDGIEIPDCLEMCDSHETDNYFSYANYVIKIWKVKTVMPSTMSQLFNILFNLFNDGVDYV